MISGVDNPREGGPDNLDIDGDELDDQNGGICVSLHTSATPISERDRDIPASFPIPGMSDGNLPAGDGVFEDGLTEDLRLDPNNTPVVEMDNPNEAIAPPHPSEVPATRLSNFRCGGGPYEYPVPNSLAPL